MQSVIYQNFSIYQKPKGTLLRSRTLNYKTPQIEEMFAPEKNGTKIEAWYSPT